MGRANVCPRSLLPRQSVARVLWAGSGATISRVPLINCVGSLKNGSSSF